MPFVLDKDMHAIIEVSRLVFVATVTPDGKPNLSPKGTVRVWDDGHIFFLDIASPTTRRNLTHNPAIELNVVDQTSRRGYRFKGRATLHDNDEIFGSATQRVFAEEKSEYPVACVVLVEIETAAPLVSPGYWHVADEWQMRRMWKERRPQLDGTFEQHIRDVGPWIETHH